MKKFICNSLIILATFLLSHSVCSKENNVAEKAVNAAGKTYDKCVKIYEQGQNTTSDMVERNIKINECLVLAIKGEVKKGFSSEQQKKMSEYINHIRKSVFEFYHTLYTENIYCDGSCGSRSILFPYADEGKILSEILEDVIYLNMKNNGY